MVRRLLSCIAACLMLHMPVSPAARAQTAASAQGESQSFDVQQLDALLAPIALYPDTLLMQVLMATTFPLQVVEAARWLDDSSHKDLKGDALTKALEPLTWDPSVKSLVPFPQVVAQMNGNLDWMQQVGYAFASQQQDVMNSIQRLRRQAQSNGKLQSTPQQMVQTQPAADGQSTVIIAPAQADTVYVPTYNPNEVYGTWPYPSYPPTYLPPPVGYVPGTALLSGLAFGAGVAITAGLWGWASPNWGRGDVNVNVNRWNNLNANRQRINSDVWQASNRPGGLPPSLRRAPATGPVGRPARGAGLPANAIGRPNVGLPGNLVNRPNPPNLGNFSGGSRPNLSPGSRPNVTPRRDIAAPGAGARPGLQQRPQAGAFAGQRGDFGGGGRSAFQRQQGGGGAFGGVREGQRAQQFGQRGMQSRQFSGGAQRGGGGGVQRGGGGGRGRR